MQIATIKEEIAALTTLVSLMGVHRKYKIVIWNANGMNNNILEIKIFFADKCIGIMLISHLTDK